MKITYNFVNGETVAIEVNDEIGKVILDMRREEESQYRRNRYNERHIDATLDYGSWNKYVQPEFDTEYQEYEEQRTVRNEKIKKAMNSLTENQKELVISLYGKAKKTQATIAREEGVSQQAIDDRMRKVRKKIKKFL